MKKLLLLLFLAMTSILSTAFLSPRAEKELKGAWHWVEGNEQQTVCFVDGYCVFSAFDVKGKKFLYTWGGPYNIDGKNLRIDLQFNTKQSELTGTTFSFPISWKGEQLQLALNGTPQLWKQIDKNDAPLAGVWRISGRKQGDKINEMPLGVRRTLKILSGTRFQWAAINIETKEFFGTGGGHYTFEKGVYTEHIEFFSRDSSRVGASLSFEGKIENGKWHHSGKSSKGDAIYEVWEKMAK